MKLVLGFAFVLAASASSVACSSADTGDSDGGKKSGGGKTSAVVSNPSCNGIGGGVCTDYVGSSAQQSVKQVCTWDGGYSNVSCPEPNRAGSCTVGAGGDPNQVIRRYYKPAFDVATAQKDCQGAMGTFTES